jgi:mycofactocin precursor
VFTSEDSAVQQVVAAPTPQEESTEPDLRDQPPDDQIVEAELLVEDVSIDGMCGVY